MTDEGSHAEEYAVPNEASTERCEYCDTPFSDEHLLALHYGLEHPDEADERHRTEFEAAYEHEQEDIRLFRLKALIVLVALYFGLLMAYAVFS